MKLYTRRKNKKTNQRLWGELTLFFEASAKSFQPSLCQEKRFKPYVKPFFFNILLSFFDALLLWFSNSKDSCICPVISFFLRTIFYVMNKKTLIVRIVWIDASHRQKAQMKLFFLFHSLFESRFVKGPTNWLHEICFMLLHRFKKDKIIHG